MPTDRITSVREPGVPVGSRPWVLAAGLLAANLIGTLGWVWDWYGHLGGVTIQAAHLLMDVGALAVIVALVVVARRAPFRSAAVVSYLLLLLVAILVLGPITLMGLYQRSTVAARLMQAYMGSLESTGGIPFAVPLLALALWAGWLWLRTGRLEVWRVVVSAGLAVLALGVVVDVYWHQTHPMVTDTGQYMNTLLLPGHQLQLLGFVIGTVGALRGFSQLPEPEPRRRSEGSR